MKHDGLTRPRPAAHVWRAAAAVAKAQAHSTSPDAMLKRMFPEDEIAPLILRGASTQAVTTDPVWAGPLAAVSVSDAISEMTIASAIGRVMAAGALVVDLGHYASVVVPGRVTNVADAGSFVAEGAAVPVRQLHVVGATLRPRKLEVIVALTREIMEASNIEDVVRALITEAAGLALDAAVFSTVAPGIFAGLTPIAPTATGGADSAYDASGVDLGNLVGDIATRAGGQFPMFIASPGQATTLRYWAGGQFGATPTGDVLPIAASAGLPAGTVACLEPRSFAAAIGLPQFTASKVAAVHMEDTTPAVDLLKGTPVKSMWQIDATALKMTLWGDWAMRAPHASIIEGVNW
jgi:hypothetical protein